MFQPLLDKVIIQEIPPEREIHGIIIPDTAKEKAYQGKVVAAGPGRILQNGTLLPNEVHVGDTVVFQKYSGSNVTIEGEQYLILSEKDVLAKVVE